MILFLINRSLSDIYNIYFTNNCHSDGMTFEIRGNRKINPKETAEG